MKCDAAKCSGPKCTRCQKYNLECIVDQNFKPRKGGQVEILREQLAKVQKQVQDFTQKGADRHTDTPAVKIPSSSDTNVKLKQNGGIKRPLDTQDHVTSKTSYSTFTTSENGADSKPTHSFDASFSKRSKIDPDDSTENAKYEADDYSVKEIEASVAERMAAGGRLVPVKGPYKLARIVLDEPLANRLHDYFMEECAPYMPMFESSSAGELYARSELLFWAVMTVAAQSEPDSELYMSFVGTVRELVASKCLLETTRSSSIVQALLVLSTWPLPSEKMLEDMSSRYASLAYSMGLQLGIHRGKFIYEFSRNQQLMPNAVKWRTRTWVQTYITQHMISASSGIPASMPVDHVIDHALHDEEHPLSPRTQALLKISMFYSKLVMIMGSSIATPDGLMESNSRCPTLNLLRTDLYTMFPPTSKFEDPVIEVSFLYARLLLDSFAFLPDTPTAHQSPFLIDAFQACTRIVTIVRQMVGTRKIVEMPSFIRNPCSLAALILFRLQLLPNLPEYYVASARESIVTVHHMYRNLHHSWLSPRVSNDISRIAKLLESLNYVMITHPELLQSRRVMRHMRSHLTFSIFYEFLYIIHEAKRRNAKRAVKEDASHAHGVESSSTESREGYSRTSSHENPIIAEKRKSHSSRATEPQFSSTSSNGSSFEESSPELVPSTPGGVGAISNLIHTCSNHNNHRDLSPLPLFNNINRESYVSKTVISPNGTTMTTLARADGDTDGNIYNGNSNGESGIQNEFKESDGVRTHHIPHEVYEQSRTCPSKSSDHAAYHAPASTHPSLQSNAHYCREPHQIAPLNSSNGHYNGHSMRKTVHNNGPISNDHIVQSPYGPTNASDLAFQASYPHDQMDMGTDLSTIFGGLDWMNTEGDDFLGWMMPREE